MTRFSATDPPERQLLFAEAVRAHRQRASSYLTIESTCGDDEEPAPWIQFSDAICNLDCTEAELDRLKSLLGKYPAFKIHELARPEDADGVNVRISAKVDEKRLAQFFEQVFREVFECPEQFEAWVTEI